MTSPDEAMVGAPIRSLQTMLRLIALNDPEVLPVIPDGIYGKNTVAAVASFQRRHELPVNGITDLATWRAISSVYQALAVDFGPAEPVLPILQPNQVIHAGEHNCHLYMMHGMMRAIAAHFPSMPMPSGSDEHDAVSVAAVQWIQRRADIEPTGEITRFTWKTLSKLYRATIGDGTRVPWSVAPAGAGPVPETAPETSGPPPAEDLEKEGNG